MISTAEFIEIEDKAGRDLARSPAPLPTPRGKAPLYCRGIGIQGAWKKSKLKGDIGVKTQVMISSAP